jgi:hypothetical protein
MEQIMTAIRWIVLVSCYLWFLIFIWGVGITFIKKRKEK